MQNQHSNKPIELNNRQDKLIGFSDHNFSHLIKLLLGQPILFQSGIMCPTRA